MIKRVWKYLKVHTVFIWHRKVVESCLSYLSELPILKVLSTLFCIPEPSEAHDCFFLLAHGHSWLFHRLRFGFWFNLLQPKSYTITRLAFYFPHAFLWSNGIFCFLLLLQLNVCLLLLTALTQSICQQSLKPAEGYEWTRLNPLRSWIKPIEVNWSQKKAGFFDLAS